MNSSARSNTYEKKCGWRRRFRASCEDVGNDATLQWQGRNRFLFLSEEVVTVQLERSEEASLCPDRGDHRIINGDNLSAMT